MLAQRVSRSWKNAFVAFFAVLFVSSVSSTDNENATYRNSSLPIDDRVEDLLRRMTLKEKAGQLFHTQIQMGQNGTLDTGDVATGRNSTETMVGEKLMTHFNLLGDVVDVRTTAEWYNRLQKRAQETRLGIPITLSSDPRHAFTENVGTGFAANAFSQWPESLGFAALRDPELVERFADIARQEYLAIGLRSSLHPQVDLSTEPRWARISGTMGEDAHLTSRLVVAYIKGFHTKEFGPNSVTTVTKHFPGGGPMEMEKTATLSTERTRHIPVITSITILFHLKQLSLQEQGK